MEGLLCQNFTEVRLYVSLTYQMSEENRWCQDETASRLSTFINKVSKIGQNSNKHRSPT